MKRGEYKIIRTDGTEELVGARPTIAAVERAIGADTLTTVTLQRNPERIVMFVDDIGISKGLPVNAKATELYHGVCRPGNTHQIRGDVAIVNDEDFGE